MLQQLLNRSPAEVEVPEDQEAGTSNDFDILALVPVKTRQDLKTLENLLQTRKSMYKKLVSSDVCLPCN